LRRLKGLKKERIFLGDKVVLRVVSFFFSVFFVNILFAQEIKNFEFAGLFYPQDKKKLEIKIEEYFSSAILPSVDNIIGVISPHAGYIFSGKIAAYSYRILKDKDFDTAIIMGPSHRYFFKGVALWGKGGFSTPLGVFKVDEEIAKELEKLKFVKKKREYFGGEHSIEVQLPFLKKVLPQVKIVPLLFGKTSYENLERLAEKLVKLRGTKRLLLIVSTDLSHYHSYSEAKKIDAETIQYIKNKDIESLWRGNLLGEARACGIYPLISFLFYTRKIGAKIKILKYANSGDAYGEKSKVVGYLSAVAYKEEESMEYSLTEEEKKILLEIARKTLESYLKDKKIPQFKVTSQRLEEKRGVFVTLKKNGQLRGCIGRIVADTPLYQAVSRMAIESALSDPRFYAVDFSELKDIEIEISVLSPFRRITSLEEIVVGRDGLMIQKGFYSGLLLPQVPLEYGWDKKTFLEHLCLKAGLPPSAYKDKDVVIYRFTACVFSEKEFSP